MKRYLGSKSLIFEKKFTIPIKTYYNPKIQLWVAKTKVEPHETAYAETEEQSIKQLQILLDDIMNQDRWWEEYE